VKILLINHYAGSPAHGMEFRPYYFAREWVRMGHEVSIAAASRSHVRGSNPEVRRALRIETIDGIRYCWFRTPDYEGNGVGRGLNLLAFLLQLMLHLRFLAGLARDGAVIASSTYPFDVLPARSIAKLARASLTYEVHDLWPLSPVEVGGMSPSHPFVLASRWAEEFAYRNADYVISMLPLAESYMCSRGLAAGKFSHVPNGIYIAEEDKASTLPELHDNALAQLKSRNHFLIGYAGSHGKANSLDTVLHAASRLRERPITFVFVGEGPEKTNLKELSRTLELDNVLFLPWLPRACVPEFLRRMDCLAIAWRRTWIYRLGVSPNKLMDYMLAGRPIIQAIDASNDMVLESASGITVPAEDPDALAKAILQMVIQSPTRAQEMGRNGRRYVEERHDIKKLARQFIGVIGSGISEEFTPAARELTKIHPA
jgi:glycosyltransferase involved in cell wall biosynthesis